MSKNDSEIPKKTLFIDIGNSFQKLAYKSDMDWIKVEGNYNNSKAISSWLEQSGLKFNRIAVCSVRKDKMKELIDDFSKVEVVELTVDTIPKDMLDYETPNTLGMDRYSGCLGAFYETESSVLVIDAGTACTMDFMDEYGVYRGGIIAPGLKSMLTIFKETAPELPEIDSEVPNGWPGKSTIESLQLGQLQFYIDGLEMAIKRFREKFGEFDIFMTGGSGSFISGFLSYDIKRDDFLIFKGMEAMLKDL